METDFGPTRDEDRDELVARLNEATANACTRERAAVTVLHERQGEVLAISYAVHGIAGRIVAVDVCRTTSWPDHAPPERLAAFLRGLARAFAAFDPAWLVDGGLVPLDLLEARSLVTADDFARALLEPARRAAVVAELFVDALSQHAGLPLVPLEDARLLHRLDGSEGTTAELLAIANEVGRTPELRGHALALLERWSTRGFARHRAVAERLFLLVERRAREDELFTIARLADRLERHGLLLPTSVRPAKVAV